MDLGITASMLAVHFRHCLAILMVAAFCFSALAAAFVAQDAAAAPTMTQMSGMEKPDCLPCKDGGNVMPLCAQMHCLVLPTEQYQHAAMIAVIAAFAVKHQPVPETHSTSLPVPPI
jgi:hypothetical protein